MSMFSGTGVALLTPFDAHDHLDLSALRQLVDHVIRGGVSYLVVLGTTGENAVLSDQEKQTLIETVIEANEKRCPILLGAGGNHTHHWAKQIEAYSQDYPVDGFLSVAPYYNKPTQAGLFAHFQTLASATDLPLILYNVPGRTACNILPETVIRLAQEVFNIVGIKESSGDLEQISYLLGHKPEGFLVLSGDDSLAVPAISLGAEGLISVVGNAFPREVSEMVQWARAGDRNRARQLHHRLAPLVGLCFEEGNPAGIKAICATLGIGSPATRLPLVPASKALRQKIEKTLAHL